MKKSYFLLALVPFMLMTSCGSGNSNESEDGVIEYYPVQENSNGK